MLYFISLIIPLSVYFSLIANSWLCYTALVVAFILLPSMELILPTRSYTPVHLGLPAKTYDFVLLLQVPIQLLLLYVFLERINQSQNTNLEAIGLTLSMGIACGVLGINVAHELGHRKSWWEQSLARLLLSTSLYTHFFVEHNYGHHRHVSTPEDPSSARKNENVYFFVVRSTSQAFLSSLKITKTMSRNKNIWTSHLLQGFYINAILILAILYFYGFKGFLYYLGAASFGIFLLESVNYIEHYGLLRKKLKTKNTYEPVKAHHSWNSNHPLGRFVLFELSRHSDHHHNSFKPFYYLESIDKAPQMPTGYPGMVLLAMIPYLWFKTMNPKLEKIESLSY